MLYNLRKRFTRKITRFFVDPDRFLNDIEGIVHVGANVGQERHKYAQLGLRVLWIEPIPEVFAQLEKNIAAFPDQRALQCLVADKADEIVEFNIANNGGASSSILKFAEHQEIWPGVVFTDVLQLRTTTLAAIFQEHSLDFSKYQALLLDTQGAELRILHGCGPLLDKYKYVKTEAADFESYENCCRLADIEAFMKAQGFDEMSRVWFAGNGKGGNYYDLVFKRRN